MEGAKSEKDPITNKGTQEKKTFKYGDKTYLLDDLLKAHADYQNSFYDFARTKGLYDDNALAGLRNAISNRISAAEGGRSFTADGRLDDDVVDNVSIEVRHPRKVGLTRKDRNVGQDNTEWAKHYIHKLIGQMKAYEPDSGKSKWNMDQHGLGAYLAGQGLNAKEIFETLDRSGKKGTPRAFDQRHAELRKHLANYKTWLEGKGFDFTKNDNEWDDDFIATLDGVINNQTWDNNALKASLRKLGGGEEFTQAFTSDRWDPNVSNEEIRAKQAAAARAAAARRAAEAEEKAWNDEVSRRYGIFAGNDRRTGQMEHYMGSDRNFDLTDDDINAHLASIGITKGTDAEKAYWDKLDADYAANPYDASVAQLILPMRGRQGQLSTIESGDYAGWKYDPKTVNNDRQSVMAVNTDTGAYEEVFIGNASADWNKIKKDYKRRGEDPSAQYRADGGVLEFQTGGSISSYEYIQDFKKQQNAARAVATGNSEDVQKARDRVVSTGEAPLTSDGATLAQPEAGFTGAEIARLASIAADITSIFLDPVTGVAVGLGSTLTNFGADIADDGFQWEDVKNLGINVGFDLLGAIPILGDALGTGAKIAKTAIKWAPRAMAGLAAFQGVANFDGMMGSWKKLTSGDKEQKMTVQDWRNIAQSISLLTGGVRAVKNKATQSKVKQKARLDDVVGVNVRNKNTGEIEQIIVDGDAAKQIRKAKGDKTQIEAELSKLDDFKNKFGDLGSLEVATGKGKWQNPYQKREQANGDTAREWVGFRSDGKAQVTDVYDFGRVPKGYGEGLGYSIPVVSDKLNSWHQGLMSRLNNKLNPSTIDQRGKIGSDAFEAEQVRLLNEQGVEAQVGKVKDAVAARKKYLEDIQGRITTTEGELATYRQKAGGDDLVARQADAEARLRGLASNDAINDAHNTIAHHTAVRERNKAKRNSLSESRDKQLSAMEEGLNAKITAKKQELDIVVARRKAIKKKLADGKSHPKLEVELKQVNSKIRKLNTEYKTLQRDVPIQIAEARARIQSQYQKAYTQLGASTKSAKGAIATAQPIAAQRKAYNEAYAQQQAAISGQELQKRLNTLQGRKSSHDPATAHTHAYKELETMLNNLRTSNPTIGGKTVNWDMDAILQRYGVNSSDVFKRGGSINKNKINKFLNYAKG